MRTHSHRLIFLVPFMALACSGDDQTTLDAGPDAAAADSTVADATKDALVSEASTDAGADATKDATSDASSDATSSDASNCNGGCKTYSSYCGSCQCLALSVSDPNPTCDAGQVNCFINPCLNKTAACVNDQCVIQ